jgi:hypothetical protein
MFLSESTPSAKQENRETGGKKAPGQQVVKEHREKIVKRLMMPVAPDCGKECFVDDLPPKEFPTTTQGRQPVPEARYNKKNRRGRDERHFFKNRRSRRIQRKKDMANVGWATPSGPFANVAKPNSKAIKHDRALR